MAVRSISVTLSSADGAKKLADIIGVSESWTHVIVSVTGTGPYTIGDSTINSTNTPFQLSGSTAAIVTREFVFPDTGDPAEELYFYSSNSTPKYLGLLVY